MVVAVSCDGKINRYSDFAQIPEAGWAYGDTLEFLAYGNDLLNAQSMNVAIRHNEKYLYRNLWIELSYNDSIGNNYIDSVNIELADAYGRWNGSGIGTSYQCSVSVPHPVTVADSTKIKVRHIMRLDTVKGIELVGVTIE